MRPTVVAVTCASLGVAGTVGGTQYLLDRFSQADSLVASDLPRQPSAVQDQARAHRSVVSVDRADSPRWLATAPNRNAVSGPAARAESDQRAESGETDDATQATFKPPSPATGSGVIDRTAVERKRAAERAARAAERILAYGTPQEIAQLLASERGWDEDQFACLSILWERESNWSVTATNSSSGAYGIPQALPAYRMASAGADWETNPTTQIKWGLSYIGDRYGTPCSAWSFWQANNWY